MVKIAVVGGGIIGIGSAVAIQENCPEIKITLISEKFSPQTTGDGAAGVWGPYLLGSTSPALIKKWSEKTHKLLLEMWKSQDSGNMGVSLIPVYHVSDDENYPEPEWKNVVFGFRKMSEEELKRFGKPGLRCGYAFSTFTCEPIKLLPHLLERFRKSGGKVKTKKIANFHSLRHDFDIVVNCTGIEALHIVPDNTVFPIRGQVIRVNAPGILYAVLDSSEHGGYFIPNQNSAILGGTHQEGDWNLSINPEDTTSITKYCYQLIPALKEAPIIRHWIGLRPGRSTVRLELENFNFTKENRKFTIIHNYGHAGSGITLFWGCAQDVTSLVQQAILASKSKL